MPLVRGVLAEAGLPCTGPALKEAGLESVLVGTGPAPFTGLRAGLVSARVLARTSGVEVYGASCLDLLARAALDLLAPGAPVIALADARRRELYWGHYVAEGPDDVRLIGRLEVGSARQLTNHLRETDALLVAEGAIPAHSAEELAGAPIGPTAPIDPAVLVRIVGARLDRREVERVGTEPLYLRRPDIQGEAPQRL